MTTPSRPAATAVPAPLWLTAKYRVLNSAADGLELAPHFAKSLLRHVEAPRRILDLLNSLVRPVNKHYISSHGILPRGHKSYRISQAEHFNIGCSYAFRSFCRHRHAGLLCAGGPQPIVHSRICGRVRYGISVWLPARRLAVRCD